MESTSLIGAGFLRLRTIDLEHRVIFEPHRGQFSAPHTAGIESDQLLSNSQSQGRPMAKNHRRVGGPAPGHVKPGHVSRRRRGAALGAGELHGSVVLAKSNAGQCIDDAAQPVRALKLIVPLRRRVAIHLPQKCQPVRSAQHARDFIGQRQGLRYGPLWKHARMNQQMTVFKTRKRLPAQPVQQLTPVRRIQNFVKRIGPVMFANAVGERKQVEVMISQQYFGAISKFAYEPQGVERPGPPVDQVADKYKCRIRRNRADLFYQCQHLLIAPLRIADCINAHK